mgnify:CR=1 FL=1
MSRTVTVKITDVDGQMISCDYCDNLAVLLFETQGQAVTVCSCHIKEAIKDILAKEVV